jgi:hypothetical protein
MDNDPHAVRAKIAKLREELTATRDRSKQRDIRDQIHEEVEKLKALLGEHNG